MPTVREYEAALQRNPSDTEAFVALRKAYRQAEAHDKLVTLYETRAQAVFAALVSRGVESKRLMPSGVGSDEAIEDNRTSAGRAKNNRVEIVFLYH